MKTDINQKISQFLDDDLNPSEQESVLLEISKQPELLKKMNRYQSVSHALRTDDFVKVDNDFLQQINQQLDKEPHYFLPKRKSTKKAVVTWQKASIAVAASVAIISVLVSQKLNFQHNTQPEAALAVASTQLDKKQVNTENLDTTPDKQEAEYAALQHERLKAYLRAHSDELYTHGSVNIHPYARVANH